MAGGNANQDYPVSFGGRNRFEDSGPADVGQIGVDGGVTPTKNGLVKSCIIRLEDTPRDDSPRPASKSKVKFQTQSQSPYDLDVSTFDLRKQHQSGPDANWSMNSVGSGMVSPPKKVSFPENYKSITPASIDGFLSQPHLVQSVIIEESKPKPQKSDVKQGSGWAKARKMVSGGRLRGTVNEVDLAHNSMESSGISLNPKKTIKAQHHVWKNVDPLAGIDMKGFGIRQRIGTIIDKCKMTGPEAAEVRREQNADKHKACPKFMREEESFSVYCSNKKTKSIR